MLYFAYQPGSEGLPTESLESALARAVGHSWRQVWTERPTASGDPRPRHVATWDGARETFRFVDATREEIAAARRLRIQRDAWGIPCATAEG